MPITEFATLEFIPPYSLDVAPLPNLFQILSSRQSSYSTYPLFFFTDATHPSVIYLISGWRDVEAHWEWIASEGNQELLTLFEPYLKVNDMVHLDLDFNEFPGDCGALLYTEYVGEQESLAGVEGESNTRANEGVMTEEGGRVWTGLGRNLDPKSRDVYRFTTCEEHVLDDIVQQGPGGTGEMKAMRRVMRLRG